MKIHIHIRIPHRPFTPSEMQLHFNPHRDWSPFGILLAPFRNAMIDIAARRKVKAAEGHTLTPEGERRWADSHRKVLSIAKIKSYLSHLRT